MSVLATLRELTRRRGAPPTIDDVAAATKLSRSKVKQELGRLVDEGQIRVLSSGIEVLPDNVRAIRPAGGNQAELALQAEAAATLTDLDYGPDSPLEELRIEVVGEPAPQGSKDPGMRESAGERLALWRGDVMAAAAARKNRLGIRTITGPVELEITFRMRRPQRPAFDVPAVRPDWDKLSRAVCDALELAGIYRDDAQVTDAYVRKRYARDVTGATIVVRWRPGDVE